MNVTCSGVQVCMGTVEPKLAYLMPSLSCISTGMAMDSTRPLYESFRAVFFDILDGSEDISLFYYIQFENKER